MELNDLIKKIFEYKKYGIKLGLERINYLVEKLGHPERKFDVIHVGGTNGKGSVCKFIESVLRNAGYRIGLFTSPHLLDFRERFVVNGEMINNDDLSDVMKKILSIAEKMEDKPTFFEISTACAFEYFREREVDFGIIEVGLGGRYDATNVVEPFLTVITNVGKDHTDVLGRDIESIAKEKAGIIKDGVPVITGCRDRALSIIREEAKRRNAEVIEGREWIRTYGNLEEQEFSVTGLLNEYKLKTKMLGKFQGFNLSLSVIALDKLQMMGVYIPEGSIERGIKNAFHPGRMHLVSKQPIILLDGAHNPDAIQSLKESLIEDFEYDRLTTVVGILKDKDYPSMVRDLSEISDTIILTKVENERACNPRELSRYADAGKTMIEKDLKRALDIAREMLCKKDMLCVTGSLYTVASAMKYLVV